MKNRFREPLIISVLLSLMGSCLFLSSCSNSPKEDSPPPDGKQWDGERWFGMEHCDCCHGKDGRGGQAPEIKLKELDYPGLLKKIRESKSIVMPSYPDKYLSDQRVADICSFLQDEKKLANAAAKSKTATNTVGSSDLEGKKKSK